MSAIPWFVCSHLLAMAEWRTFPTLAQTAAQPCALGPHISIRRKWANAERKENILRSWLYRVVSAEATSHPWRLWLNLKWSTQSFLFYRYISDIFAIVKNNKKLAYCRYNPVTMIKCILKHKQQGKIIVHNFQILLQWNAYSESNTTANLVRMGHLTIRYKLRIRSSKLD